MILIILSFVLPLLFAYGVSFIKRTIYQTLFIILIAILIVIFLPSFRPKEYSFFYEYSAEDTGICATTWENEYLPVWVKECAGAPARNEIEIKNGTFRLAKTNKLVYEGISKTSHETDLIAYKYYYPGWNVQIDGKDSELDYRFSKQGIFKTRIPSGEHSVKIYYAKTLLMWIADLISLISVGVVFLLLTKFLYYTKKKRK